ncbi:hypothetical protein KSP40_PGU019228 [Platanthera guangdongensis]|uniref:Uncharacterized protein n=1 Tax=Platanthera guangdongensis TaxID=2320717 RepID=A0ABR2LND4_9ASPA
MGCGGSKLEELDAVGFCRGRSDLLAEAIRHRYALADAHAAYAESLRAVGAALHQLINSGHVANMQGSPVLPLPAQRKGDPPPPLSPPPAATAIPFPHSHSHSQSGSHINFHSSNDSDSDGDSPLHSDDDSPLHLHSIHRKSLTGPTYFNLQYARNNPPPPSVTFEQQQVHYASVAEPSSSYLPNSYNYSGMDGFFGSSSPPPSKYQYPQGGSGANSKLSTSMEAPPPPSPPRTSTWAFLNPFESFESYYPIYSSSRNSKELREDEGIPDLEEDEQEVIKEAYGDPKFATFISETAAPEYSGSTVDGSNYNPRSKEEDEELVEKNVVGGEVQKPHEERRYHDVSEVAGEIKLQFEKAAESTKELAGMLEVGRQPYKRKSSFYAVSSKMLCVIPVSIWKDEDLDYQEEKVMSTGNLSSTLQKLYIWEQKLHDEVRVEKKMRLLHDRNSQKLHQLDRKGAESHKIEVTQTLIRKLSTKGRIAIQVVNSISTKIVMLRDEELWPQMDELIQGLQRMWRAMSECHHLQSKAIYEASYIDSIVAREKLTHEHMKAIMQLELELLRWTGNFSSWINSQKNFVKSLNSWLLLCLHFEPEVTADGIPPYSPRRMGAPQVVVVFNNWFQALERVSVNEVLDAMKSSAASLKQVWEEGDTEPREKMIAIREVERLNKKLTICSGKDDFLLGQPPHAEPIRLQSALIRVFQAVENFAADAMDAYDGLNAHAVEERANVEKARGS